MSASSRSSRAWRASWTTVGTASSSRADGELEPAVLEALERAALHEVAQRLLEEERVAAGALREDLGDLGGQGPAGRAAASGRLASCGSARSSISLSRCG